MSGARAKRREPPFAKRRFGQNFLHDQGVISRLLRSFDVRDDDCVVEIGPGRGALSVELAASAGRYLALEVDGELIPDLAKKLEAYKRATVRQDDATKVDWDGLARAEGARLRVIGNLPYNVGTAILRRLFAAEHVRDIQIVLQLEVVSRILSSEGSKAYGPLSIVPALRFTGQKVFTIAPESFKPRPKVRSAALLLTKKARPLISGEDIAWLEPWLFRGFRHRRKTLAGNLEDKGPLVRQVLEEHGLATDARAEALSPETWLALARRLQESTPGGGHPKARR